MEAVGLIFLLVVVGVGGFLLTSAFNKRRIERYTAIATTHGLGFDPGDPGNVTSLNFDFFDRGHSAKATFTMWRSGVPVNNRVFQYKYVTGSGKESQTHNNTCALIALPFTAPSTHVRPEGVGGRLLNMVGVRDIELESPTFNDRFRVTSDDDRFAATLIDPSFMGWLLENSTKLQWYLLGSWMLGVNARLQPEELPDLLAYAERVVANMPTVLQSLYPPS